MVTELEEVPQEVRQSLVEKYGDSLGNALFYYLKDMARPNPISELGDPNPRRRDLAQALMGARESVVGRRRVLAEEAVLEVMEFIHSPHRAFRNLR